MLLPCLSDPRKAWHLLPREGTAPTRPRQSQRWFKQVFARVRPSPANLPVALPPWSPPSLESTGFWRPDLGLCVGLGAFAREDRAPLASSALWCHRAECVPHAGTALLCLLGNGLGAEQVMWAWRPHACSPAEHSLSLCPRMTPCKPASVQWGHHSEHCFLKSPELGAKSCA